MKYCPSCGKAGVEGMKFCPQCGQGLTGFDLEEKQRYIHQPEAPLKERNWFQRHLNWTLIAGFLVSCLIITLIMTALAASAQEPLFTSISDVGYLLGIWVVSTSVPLLLSTAKYAYFTVYFLIPVGLFLVLCGWVLSQKKRSLGWLLLPFFIPLGWIVLLRLKNQRF